MGEALHTFTVTVDRRAMSDRRLEKIDWAVEILRDVAGVTVTGWCDDNA